MIPCVRPRSVPAGTVVFRRGDPGDGLQDEPSGDYLKFFVSRLRAKIELDGRRFIETERGLGYRFLRPPALAV